jgi:hypothetical protein
MKFEVRSSVLEFRIKYLVMKVAAKIAALLLIAALVLATGAWTAVDRTDGPLSTPDQHPAGCHAHGSESRHGSLPSHSPLPAPVSYQCCLTGHVAALVQASDSSQLSVQYTRVTLQIEPARTISILPLLEVSTVLSGDPSGTTPLRI